MLPFNNEVLEQIKMSSNLLFTPDEIAVIIDLPSDDVDQFVKCCNHREMGGEIYKAYQSGRLEQEMLIRKSIFVAAKNGSPPAQSMAAKIILNAKLK